MKSQDNSRSAGILLHISSLPGKWPAGDFGPEAFRFVKQLKKAGQQYWQLLPLNSLDSSKGFSPYSPLSAFAGNTLFINPDLLAKKGLLDHIPEPLGENSQRISDYRSADKIKNEIIDRSFDLFLRQQQKELTQEFEEFCRKESYWLEDYALYISLRKFYNAPWYKWPKELRDRSRESLEEARDHYRESIMREKYAQYLFYDQWFVLKEYCHKQQVQVVGDIPIYISHDSADVWSNPGFFRLTPGKAIAGVAGVPPDYFNDKGQLWNMPVYNWKNLEKDNFSWWIRRLEKNLELFDIVRLDHFRGFSSYWEVKGGSEDAVSGKWKKGPGEKIFDIILKKFPSLPFIAEDLGDVDQPVYDLRDRYNLPGMRILQFAFDEDMPKSIFIPHNYTINSVVYTGTHDNNTVRGWFSGEVSKKGKKNLYTYLGKRISKKNVHRELIRETYKSVAKMAIVPMQDVLGLGKKDRMNYPSTESGNWLWRMKNKEFGKKEVKWLRQLVRLYNREK